MTLVIAADEIKKTLKGYTPEKSEQFHHESAKIADKMYTDVIKNRGEPNVILLSGGTASGKSEYVSEYLQDSDAIILDGTLPTFGGAKIKIDRALKRGKHVAIHAVFPKDFFIAFIVFLSRERKFDVSHFYRTHSTSRQTLLEITRKYPPLVEITVIISEYVELREGGSMKFSEAQFSNRDKLLEFITKAQYNEDTIKKEIIRHVSKSPTDTITP